MIFIAINSEFLPINTSNNRHVFAMWKTTETISNDWALIIFLCIFPMCSSHQTVDTSRIPLPVTMEFFIFFIGSLHFSCDFFFLRSHVHIVSFSFIYFSSSIFEYISSIFIHYSCIFLLLLEHKIPYYI